MAFFTISPRYEKENATYYLFQMTRCYHAVFGRHPDQGMPGGGEGRDDRTGRMPEIRGDAQL